MIAFFTEDEAVAIYANYSQVRQYPHKKDLGRNFFRQSPSKGKSIGFQKGKRKRQSKRSRCTRQTETPDQEQTYEAL